MRDGRHEAKGRRRALDAAAWWFRIDLPCSRLFRRIYRGSRPGSRQDTPRKRTIFIPPLRPYLAIKVTDASLEY